MEMSGQLYAPASLSTPKNSPIPAGHWKGGCTGFRGSVDIVEKRKISSLLLLVHLKKERKKSKTDKSTLRFRLILVTKCETCIKASGSNSLCAKHSIRTFANNVIYLLAVTNIRITDIINVNLLLAGRILLISEIKYCMFKNNAKTLGLLTKFAHESFFGGGGGRKWTPPPQH
jgi:hypothetical protein